MNKRPKTEFTQNFLRLNALEDAFLKWHFRPGMGFKSEVTWWGEKGKRKRPHEGMDLLYFWDQERNINRCRSDVLIPALMTGEIVAIFPDFLGHSILFRHTFSQKESHLFSVLGHVTPVEGVSIGLNWVDLEQPVARLAARAKKQNVPSHLHISMFSGAEDIIDDKIDWTILSDPACAINFIDPLSFVG